MIAISEACGKSKHVAKLRKQEVVGVFRLLCWIWRAYFSLPD